MFTQDLATHLLDIIAPTSDMEKMVEEYDRILFKILHCMTIYFNKSLREKSRNKRKSLGFIPKEQITAGKYK